jgi:hypothetical protein
MFRILTAIAFVGFSGLSAFASQGPGTSAGTATGLEQTLLVGAIIAFACVGLAFRFRRG